jgi:hypothetical protein
MDISDLLASMQDTAGERALARNTEVPMIPDPSGSAMDNMGGEPDYAVNPNGDWWSDMPEGNVEDRRVTTYDGTEEIDNGGMIQKQSFEDGGLVEEVLEPEQGAIPEPEVTAPVTEAPAETPAEAEPAIPEMEAEGEAGAEGVGTRTGRVGSRALFPQDTNKGTVDWKTDAMEAINSGIEYGMNSTGVNQAVDDGTGEQGAYDYLSGKGSVPADQMQSLMESIDPEGQMDDGERWQKALAIVHRHYKGDDTKEDKSGQASFGVLQYARRFFNASAAYAAVAIERGGYQQAAGAATKALNSIPDGLNVAVNWLGDQWSAANERVDSGTDAFSNSARNISNAVSGAPAYTPQGPQNPRTQLDGNSNIQVGKPDANGVFQIVVTDPDANGRVVMDEQISPQKLEHMLANGFDRALLKGTVNSLGEASRATEGFQQWPRGTRTAQAQDPRVKPGNAPLSTSPQGRGPGRGEAMTGSGNIVDYSGEPPAVQGRGSAPADGRDMAERNGLPRGTNLEGLSVGEISRLRRQHAGIPTLTPTGNRRQPFMSDDRVVGARIASQAARDKEIMRGANNLEREGIRGDVRLTQEQMRQKGLDRRGANAPGQAEASRRGWEAAARKETEAWANNHPKPGTITREMRNEYYRRALADIEAEGRALRGQPAREGGQQAPAPQGGAQQRPTAPRAGDVVRGYRFNGGNPADKNNWQPVR